MFCIKFCVAEEVNWLKPQSNGIFFGFPDLEKTNKGIQVCSVQGFFYFISVLCLCGVGALNVQNLQINLFKMIRMNKYLFLFLFPVPIIPFPAVFYPLKSWGITWNHLACNNQSRFFYLIQWRLKNYFINGRNEATSVCIWVDIFNI